MTHADIPRGPGREPGFRLTGWRVLGIFVVFFGVVAAVDGSMMVRAYRTYPGEVSATPYEDGLSYDKVLARERAQADLGWRTAIALAGPGAIQVTAHDRSGAPIVFTRISAHLERPATLQGAHDVRFGLAGPGVYRAEVAGLSGAWDVTVSGVDAAGHRFDAAQRLVAP